MRIRGLCVALGALGMLLGAGAADAKEDRTRSTLARATAPSLRGNLALSLNDAIAMGLENNLGVEIQRHAPLIAFEDSRIAWGAYDPEWNSEFGIADDRRPSANALATGGVGAVTVQVQEVNQETLGGFGGIRGLLPWLNTSISTTLDTQELQSSIPFQALRPEYSTGLNFVARQPLLRGLIWNETWTQVKVSGVLYESAVEDFRRNVMDVVQGIEDAYWALIADEERVRVAEKSLETAKALLDQVTTQYEVGVVSKVEIAEAEAGVAARDFELITAQNRYHNTMDLLVDQVLGPNLRADTTIQIDPTDRPDEYVPYDIDVQQAYAIAVQRRPELAIADREIERLQLNLKFAKNQRLPQLDLEGRYGHAGLSGETRRNAGLTPQDLGGWQRSFEPESNSYGVRGIVTVPLGNVRGRHGVSRAELELRRAEVQRRRVEQDIVLQVRESARNLKSAQEGIEAAERRQAAAAEQLRAENIRLEYGESTPFDVLLREEDLVAAEQEFIGAFQVYRSSVTALDRAQGTILRNRNVRIEEAARLR